jgi:hypothetical protein
MTKSYSIPARPIRKKRKPLRFVRVAEPSKSNERPLVIVDRDADKARNAARDGMDRKRNTRHTYPMNRQHEADCIMRAQRNRR